MKTNKLIGALLFVASMILWFQTLDEMIGNPEWKSSLLEDQGMSIDYFERLVTTLWGVSLYFKYWLIAALATTVICWPVGVLLTMFGCIGSLSLSSFMLVEDGATFCSAELTNISMWIWVCIMVADIIIVALWFLKEVLMG